MKKKILISFGLAVLVILSASAAFVLHFVGVSLSVGPFYSPKGVTMESNENYNKANTALHQGRTEEALIFMKEAEKDGYRHPFIFSNLAVESMAKGKYDEALRYSGRAVEVIESGNISVMFPNELEMFKTENRPKIEADLYSIHAASLYELGRLDEAEAFAEKAYDLHEDNPRTREVLGLVALQKSDYEKAISIFKDFTDKVPNYYQGYFHLGRAQLASGRFEEGKASLSKFLTYCPPFHLNAQVARSLLQEAETEETTSQ